MGFEGFRAQPKQESGEEVSKNDAEKESVLETIKRRAGEVALHMTTQIEGITNRIENLRTHSESEHNQMLRTLEKRTNILKAVAFSAVMVLMVQTQEASAQPLERGVSGSGGEDVEQNDYQLGKYQQRLVEVFSERMVADGDKLKRIEELRNIDQLKMYFQAQFAKQADSGEETGGRHANPKVLAHEIVFGYETEDGDLNISVEVEREDVTGDGYPTVHIDAQLSELLSE